MERPFCLIVNPAAGRGRGRRRLPAALSALRTGGAEVEVRESASLADAAAIAAGAAVRGQVAVAVGGDGMVGALAGALAGASSARAAGPTAGPSRPAAGGGSPAEAGGTLGIIPAGRGNDFARMLGIPADPAGAARVLLRRRERAVDLIGVRAGDGPELAVAGSVYLGIPSEGGEIANASRWAAGPLGYQIAGLRAVARWRGATFTVRAGGPDGPQAGLAAAAAAGAADAAEWDGARSFPGFCVVVANSAYLAAGLRAAPEADIGDGLLDVVVVREAGAAPDARIAPPAARSASRRLPLAWKAPFLQVMLKAGRGTHVHLPHVSVCRAASVLVAVDRDMPAAADGETLPLASPLRAGTPLLVRALPGALRVVAPAPVALSPRGALSVIAAGR